MSNKLITILGPTAVGKTKFAVYLASVFNGEIISADSRQVYRHMDIGTGKDLQDYSIGAKQIEYHLIDVVEPAEEFNLYMFKKMFDSVYNLIISRSKIPVMVGGTGLYLSSVLQKYKLPRSDFNSERYRQLSQINETELIEKLLMLKSNQHNVTDLLDKDRIIKAILVAESSSVKDVNIDYDALVIGVTLNRRMIKENITGRLKERLGKGMIEEVENLIKRGITLDKLKYFGLEYKFIAMYLNGELNYNDMYQKLNSAICQFAKRQMTWFRKMEKEGITINWLAPNETGKAELLINNFLKV